MEIQAIWALGNISGDAVFRDRILKLGGLQPLLDILNETTSRVILKHGSWTLSNLCRGKPLPPIVDVEIAIPTVCRIIQVENDVELLIDVAWALTYLSRESRIKPIVESGVVPKLINLLKFVFFKGTLITCLALLS